jgi:hypothetical protein
MSKQNVMATERQAQALDLRGRGLSYREIARRLGYQGPAGAYKAVASGLDKTLREHSEDVRQLELQRLDALLEGCWSKATTGDAKAIRAALRIMERRAKLLGLDAPSRGVLLTAEIEDVLDLLPPTLQAAIRARLLQGVE